MARLQASRPAVPILHKTTKLKSRNSLIFVKFCFDFFPFKLASYSTSIPYNWIGRSIRADKKQFVSKPQGLQQFRDHCWKALGKENSEWPQQNKTRQIWIRLVKYSSTKVSDLSEGPQIIGKLIFHLVKEVKLICVHSIILCSRVPEIV